MRQIFDNLNGDLTDDVDNLLLITKFLLVLLKSTNILLLLPRKLKKYYIKIKVQGIFKMHILWSTYFSVRDKFSCGRMYLFAIAKYLHSFAFNIVCKPCALLILAFSIFIIVHSICIYMEKKVFL